MNEPTLDMLVVARAAPDLRGLQQALGDEIDGHVGNLHIAGKAVGVGVVAAASGSGKRVFQLQPRCVVLVGTCGVYPGAGDYQPYDVIVPTQTMLVDHAVDASHAAFPGPMSTRIDMHAALSAGLASCHGRAHQVAVASALAETRDGELAARLTPRHQCHAEHLELYGVATTCKLGRIPFAAVLVVTHIIGSQADADEKKFQRDATIAAAGVVISWAHAGASGLPHT